MFCNVERGGSGWSWLEWQHLSRGEGGCNGLCEVMCDDLYEVSRFTVYASDLKKNFFMPALTSWRVSSLCLFSSGYVILPLVDDYCACVQ